MDILTNATEPVKSDELQQQVIESTGCSERTYYATHKALGVFSARSGRAWYSHLPKDSQNR